MIFTHTGKLGDFIFSLPVANWYYKISGEKIHYVISEDVAFFKDVIPEFCKYVNCVDRVSVVPHRVIHYDCGGQPYRFNPADFGIKGKYFNLGYRHFPYKYCAPFMADEHGFDVDYDNLFNIEPDLTLKDIKVYTNERNYIAPLVNKDEYAELSFKDPLHVNVAKILGAKEVRTFHSGFAALCDLLVPEKLYVYASPSISIYGKIFFKSNDFLVKNNRYIII